MQSLLRHVRRRALFALATAGLLLAFITPATGGRLPRYGGTLRVEIPRLPQDLDPLRLAGDEGAQVAACMYEGLTRRGPNGIEPALAQRWIRSADSRRWVFYLRDGVRFHDGHPCDARAVQESLHRLADPERSRFAWILRDVVGWNDFVTQRTAQIEGIYVVSATEIEFHLRVSTPDFPQRLASPAAGIVRWQGLVPVGTGPYRAVGAVGDALRLSAFAGHRDGRPFLDGIDFVVPGASDSGPLASVAFMRRVDPAEAVRPGTRRLRAPASRLGLALIHPRSAALREPATRRRLANGFDGGVFVRATLSGDGEAAHGFTPGVRTRREARIEERDGDLLQRPQGRVRIVTPAGEPVLKRLGDRLQVHLFALGFEASVEVLAPPALESAVRAGSYDVLLVGWTPPATGGNRDEPLRLYDALGRLLLPTLGVHAPAGLADVLEQREPAEAALLDSGHVVPLIFFHDAWETSGHLADVRPAKHHADLGLIDAHLQPMTP